MESRFTFRKILDEIFEEIERFERVEIDYQVTERESGGITEKVYHVNSVNGFFDPLVFLHAAEILGENLVSDVKTMMRTLASGEQQAFMESAIRRTKQLKTNVFHNEFSPETSNTLWEDPRAAWFFTGNCVLGADMEVPWEVLRKTSLFAYCWVKSIKENIRQLEVAARDIIVVRDVITVRDEVMPVHEGTGCGQPVIIRPAKLKVERTVPQVAGHLRLLLERGAFGNIHKTELCRTAASFLATLRQEEVSWLSLKNHLDCPGEDVLLHLRMEYHLMMQWIGGQGLKRDR